MLSNTKCRVDTAFCKDESRHHSEVQWLALLVTEGQKEAVNGECQTPIS